VDEHHLLVPPPRAGGVALSLPVHCDLARARHARPWDRTGAPGSVPGSERYTVPDDGAYVRRL